MKTELGTTVHVSDLVDRQNNAFACLTFSQQTIDKGEVSKTATNMEFNQQLNSNISARDTEILVCRQRRLYR
jgi:hypothetical protein